MEKVCRKCHAILHEPIGMVTQSFCHCCSRGHNGPLCGDCSRARNVYRELFEDLDRALRGIVNSGVDHEFTKTETINLNAAEDLASSLWIKSKQYHDKLKAEGKVE